MTDPFPELPRRVLYVDVTKPVVTKLAKPVTKPKDVTKCASKSTASGRSSGRPRKGDKPMTGAERVRLHRAAKKEADHAS